MVIIKWLMEIDNSIEGRDYTHLDVEVIHITFIVDLKNLVLVCSFHFVLYNDRAYQLLLPVKYTYTTTYTR